MTSSSCRRAICARDRRCVTWYAAMRKEFGCRRASEGGAVAAMVGDAWQTELPHVPVGVPRESGELRRRDLVVVGKPSASSRCEHGPVERVVLGPGDDRRHHVSPAGRGEVEGREQALHARLRLGAPQPAPRVPIHAPCVLHREGWEDARKGREEGVELRRQRSYPPSAASAPRGRPGGSGRGRSPRAGARGAAHCP